MFLKRALTALILVGFAGIAFGGTGMPLIQSSEPISLDSLVRLGLRHNPDVKNSEYLTKLNSIGNLAAVGRFLPSISLGLNFSQSEFENRTYVNPDGSVSSLPVTQEEVVIVPDSTGQ
ncbi:hypothetical protein IT157_02360, partial [bacterium]|nr:hypothetical protein [bacterium]